MKRLYWCWIAIAALTAINLVLYAKHKPFWGATASGKVDIGTTCYFPQVAAVATATVPAKWASCRASHYGAAWNGRRTANGEYFDCNLLTCAHKTLPFGTRLEVRHNGKTVVVRVNDRGPFIKGRELDLSSGAFAKLAPLSRGVITVEYRRLAR